MIAFKNGTHIHLHPALIKAYTALRKSRVMLWIKFLVIGACIYVLHSRLNAFDFRPDFLYKYPDLGKIIFFFLLLAGVNFFLDVYLWANISGGKRKNRLRLSHYARHHLISLSLGFITPNNLGEYGGKMRQFDAPTSKIKGFLLAFHFRTVKTVARNLIGLAAVIWLYTADRLPYLTTWQIGLLALFVSLYALFYVFLEDLLPLISSFSIQGKNYFQLFLRIRFSLIQKTKWTLVSSIKFLVYVVQLTLLLKVSEQDIGLFVLMANVCFYYSLASYLPTILAFDPIVKGAAGILMLRHLGLNDWIVLTSVTMVWVTNVAFPSIVGSFLWLRKKIPAHL